MSKKLRFHEDLPPQKGNEDPATWDDRLGTLDLTGKKRSGSDLDSISSHIFQEGRRYNPKDYDLKRILKPLQATDNLKRYNATTEEVIALDQRGRIAEDHLLNRWIKNLDYYWLSYENVAEVKGLQFSVLDVKAGANLNIVLDYQVQLIRGQAEEALKLLIKEDSPVKTLNELVTQWIKSYCSTLDHLNEQFLQLEDAVKNYVVSRALQHGLSLQLFLRPEREDPAVQEYSLVDHEVKCDIKNSTITVKLNLALNLVNKRQFRMSNIRDMDQYARTKTDQIVQNELLSVSYAQLIRDFNPKGIEGRIRNKIEAAFLSIGFSVTQLVAIPQLDIFRQVNFHFVTDEDEKPDDSYSKLEFATKDSRINVKLSIAVSGRILSFDGEYMEQHLKPGVNLVRKMKDSVIHEARKFLHEIEPQEFYFHFSSSTPGETSFQSELETRIANKLMREYNAGDLNIIIKQVDTDITLRFKELQKGSHQLVAQNFSEEIGFIIWYKIKAIHPEGWPLFQSNDYPSSREEAADISRKIKNYVEYFFNNELPADFYQVKGRDFQKAVIRAIEGPSTFNGQSFGPAEWLSELEKPECAKKEIIREFGLVIEVVDIKRLATGLEQELIEEQRNERRISQAEREHKLEINKLRLTHKTQDLAQLYDQLREFKDIGMDEEAREVQEKIDAIENTITHNTDLKEKAKRLEGSKDAVKKLRWINPEPGDETSENEEQEPPAENEV